MTRGALVAAALVADCYFDATVGHVRAPSDAAFDASDAAFDASDAGDATETGEVVAVDDPHREVTGLGSLAPTVSLDPASPSDHFRLYYLGRDGAVWVERRLSATLALECAESLGAPGGLAIAGRPGAGDRPSQVVVAPVRAADGRLQLWLREEGSDPGACTGAFAPWTPLPPCPYELTSAPTVYQFPIGQGFPAGNTYVLASAREGLVMLLRRAGAPNWEWTLAPGQPGDEQVYGRPGVLEWGANLEVFVLAAGASGRARLLHTIYFGAEDRWFAAWLEEPLETDDPPATAVDARSFFPRTAEPNQWLAYAGESGRLWTRTFHVVGADALWSTWQSQPAIPRGELAAVPSAISLGVARTVGATSELVITSAPPDERGLYVSRWSGATGWFGPWSPAPGALR